MKCMIMLMLGIGLLTIFTAYAHSQPTPQGLALGLHGVGKQWNAGNPTLRWRIGDSYALDLTPSFGYWYSNTASGSYPMHYCDIYLEAGWVRTLHRHQGLIASVRVALAYGMFVDGHSDPDIVTSSVDLSVGPDLEYSLPVLPQLTIGAQAVVRVHHARERYGSHLRYRDTDVELLGQLLTIRYYF